MAGVLATVGDLVEDIVVRSDGPLHVGSDTPARIERRRGGSAANVAVSAVRAGGRARFIGQVGDDDAGTWLARRLADDGVDVVVRRGGRTGAIVVVVDAAGERSFLTDRGACALLDAPEQRWLDGVDALHVPLYSLIGDPLATSAATLVAWAHERGLRVSIDLSSAAVVEHHGRDATVALIARLAPDVLLCNEMEAAALGGVDALDRAGATLTIVKHGAAPAEVRALDGRTVTSSTVAAERVDDVTDTTGAGDAFAAGVLLALGRGADPCAAAAAGHRTAAALLRTRSRPTATVAAAAELRSPR